MNGKVSVRNARMVRREAITMKKEWKEEIKERLVAEILKATNAEEVEQIINKFFKDYMFYGGGANG